MARYKRSEKEGYLDYYKKTKSRKQKPQKFGTWLGLRRGSKGSSRQTRKGLQYLDDATAKDISKFFKR